LAWDDVCAENLIRPVGLDYSISPRRAAGLEILAGLIFSVFYLLVRCLPGCLVVLARCEVSKDAELLVLRHENTVLRRQTGRVRYQPGDRLWLAALSRLIPGIAGQRCSP